MTASRKEEAKENILELCISRVSGHEKHYTTLSGEPLAVETIAAVAQANITPGV